MESVSDPKRELEILKAENKKLKKEIEDLKTCAFPSEHELANHIEELKKILKEIERAKTNKEEKDVESQAQYIIDAENEIMRYVTEIQKILLKRELWYLKPQSEIK